MSDDNIRSISMEEGGLGMGGGGGGVATTDGINSLIPKQHSLSQ